MDYKLVAISSKSQASTAVTSLNLIESTYAKKIADLIDTYIKKNKSLFSSKKTLDLFGIPTKYDYVTADDFNNIKNKILENINDLLVLKLRAEDTFDNLPKVAPILIRNSEKLINATQNLYTEIEVIANSYNAQKNKHPQSENYDDDDSDGIPLCNSLSSISQSEINQRNYELTILTMGGTRYKIVEKIKPGKQGELFKVKPENDTNDENLQVIKIEQCINSSIIKIQKQEIEVLTKLKSLKHDNVCQIFELEETAENILVRMEYVAGKDLKGQKLSPKETPAIIKQLVAAFTFLHEHNIFHNDIKLENIMYDQEKKEVKVVDFGVSTIGESEGILRGSPIYTAPEMFDDTHKSTEKTNVFSLGMCFAELYLGYNPLEDYLEKKNLKFGEAFVQITSGYAIKNITDLSKKLLAKGTPPEMAPLIINMLSADSNKRPTMEEAKTTIYEIWQRS